MKNNCWVKSYQSNNFHLITLLEFHITLPKTGLDSRQADYYIGFVASSVMFSDVSAPRHDCVAQKSRDLHAANQSCTCPEFTLCQVAMFVFYVLGNQRYVKLINSVENIRAKSPSMEFLYNSLKNLCVPFLKIFQHNRHNNFTQAYLHTLSVFSPNIFHKW